VNSLETYLIIRKVTPEYSYQYVLLQLARQVAPERLPGPDD
jgi:hypothetical protein